MRRAFIILLIFLLGFGCIEDISYPSEKSEQIFNQAGTDLDQDGIVDYSVYFFSPVTVADGKVRVQREVSVTTITSAEFTSIKPNLTDIDLIIADQDLDEFSQSRFQADSACSKNIGLLNVICSDVLTCSRLCSGSSLRCKQIAEKYDEVLAGSMISFVQDNNEIRSNILDARRMILDLREADDAERDVFLEKIRDIISGVANINANPLYSHPSLGLCTNDDYGVSYLSSALDRIGTSSTTAESYKYRVMFLITPVGEDSSKLGKQIAGIGLEDAVPSASGVKAQQISSVQDIAAEEDQAGKVVISWNSPSPSDEGYLVEYEFVSAKDPDTLVASMRRPEVSVRTIDFSSFIPTNMLFLALSSISGNYYLGLGYAIALSIVAILLAYNILMLMGVMIKERASGASFTSGFRKAFGRTDVRWKSDLVVAAVFLCGGYYVSTFIAISPQVAPSLLETIQFLVKNNMGMVAVGFNIIGIAMLYFSAENFSKIMILERAYGIVIRRERDLYFERIEALKNGIEELTNLVKTYMAEDFEVTKEYETVSAMKGLNTDRLAAGINSRNRMVVEDSLTRVENSIASLKERKKLADENWTKWKDNITKMLDEQDEVYSSSLITIPSSLRTWALRRYVDEAGDGIVLEGDAIRREKISAGSLVTDMIKSKLLSGAIVIRQDSIETAEFSGHDGTVSKALCLKLRTYLRSLAKKLGQHEPASFVSIGEKSVLVYMKGKSTESVLFINKAKFNQAIEQWKAKLRVIEGA